MYLYWHATWVREDIRQPPPELPLLDSLEIRFVFSLTHHRLKGMKHVGNGTGMPPLYFDSMSAGGTLKPH